MPTRDARFARRACYAPWRAAVYARRDVALRAQPAPFAPRHIV